ncbi:hypothetical protein [Kiloniella sp. b19]|uniref:hypothetical protein n=1 Tax=Kiloniella sp. GXU_MW_B19 TaxID=3141326 RepID=UPI0031D23FA3
MQNRVTESRLFSERQGHLIRFSSAAIAMNFSPDAARRALRGLCLGTVVLLLGGCSLIESLRGQPEVEAAPAPQRPEALEDLQKPEEVVVLPLVPKRRPDAPERPEEVRDSLLPEGLQVHQTVITELSQTEQGAVEEIPVTAEGLVGADYGALLSMLGQPVSIREQYPARVWSYQTDLCKLNVYLFPRLEQAAIAVQGGELQPGSEVQELRFRALTLEVFEPEDMSAEARASQEETVVAAETEDGQENGQRAAAFEEACVASVVRDHRTFLRELRARDLQSGGNDGDDVTPSENASGDLEEKTDADPASEDETQKEDAEQ